MSCLPRECCWKLLQLTMFGSLDSRGEYVVMISPQHHLVGSDDHDPKLDRMLKQKT